MALRSARTSGDFMHLKLLVATCIFIIALSSIIIFILILILLFTQLQQVQHAAVQQGKRCCHVSSSQQKYRKPAQVTAWPLQALFCRNASVQRLRSLFGDKGTVSLGTPKTCQTLARLKATELHAQVTTCAWQRLAARCTTYMRWCASVCQIM